MQIYVQPSWSRKFNIRKCNNLSAIIKAGYREQGVDRFNPQGLMKWTPESKEAGLKESSGWWGGFRTGNQAEPGAKGWVRKNMTPQHQRQKHPVRENRIAETKSANSSLMVYRRYGNCKSERETFSTEKVSRSLFFRMVFMFQKFLLFR